MMKYVFVEFSKELKRIASAWRDMPVMLPGNNITGHVTFCLTVRTISSDVPLVSQGGAANEYAVESQFFCGLSYVCGALLVEVVRIDESGQARETPSFET